MRLLSIVVLLSVVEVPVLGAQLHWHKDYGTAYREAEAKAKLLLISFREGDDRYAPPPEAVKQLQPFVLLDVPTTATLTGKAEDKLLLDYSAFRSLKKAPGLAIVLGVIVHQGEDASAVTVSSEPVARDGSKSRPRSRRGGTVVNRSTKPW